MSEFVGRTGSLRVYSYPEPRRSGGTPLEYARNFAAAKSGAEPLGAETNVTWIADVVWSEGGADNTKVPITPILTGVVEISGFLVITNADTDPHEIELVISVDGTELLLMESEAIVPGEGELAIPFMAQAAGLTLSDTVAVTIVLDAGVSDTGLALEGGAMAVQEVAESTG